MPDRENGLRSYQVTVERQDKAHALASSHGHTLTLGARQGDSTAGFNAAETLLASLGACLITNVTALAEKMRLQVDQVRVEIEGDRRDEPPGIVQIRYRLVLDSPEPLDKLEKLHEVVFRWGTVTNTLLDGAAIQGDLLNAR
ncbi:MAG: OsmC family protein [Anaerolineae bacterium]|nr:OsmC family protein [Anaerolineae bacterium]